MTLRAGSVPVLQTRSGGSAQRRAWAVSGGVAAAVGLLLAAQAGGAPLAGAWASALSVGAILLLGLPHGALDIRKLRRDRTGPSARRSVLATYLALAGAMALAWALAPALALVAFLAIAAAHFAVEAAEDAPAPAAWVLGALVIVLPTATHPSAVQAIFQAMGGRAAASALVYLAPAAALLLLAALAGAILWRPPRLTVALETTASLAGLALLPPLVGFAVFFGLLHSPRHLARAGRALGLDARATLAAAAPFSLAALGLGAVLMLSRTGTAQAAPAGAFVLLSILTAPHMFTGALLRLRSGREPEQGRFAYPQVRRHRGPAL